MDLQLRRPDLANGGLEVHGLNMYDDGDDACVVREALFCLDDIATRSITATGMGAPTCSAVLPFLLVATDPTRSP